MMEYLNVDAIIVAGLIVAGLMVGSELAIAAFVHPTLDRLADNVHLPLAFMPFLVHPRIPAYFSRGLVPMAPIQPLTYLDCYVGHLWTLASVYSITALAGQQPYCIREKITPSADWKTFSEQMGPASPLTLDRAVTFAPSGKVVVGALASLRKGE